MFCHTGLRGNALGDRREWLNVFSHWAAREATRRSSGAVECLSHLTAQEGTWRSSGVAECIVGDFGFEAENVNDRMLVLSLL